ncbi:hypothetical protein V6N13_059860 [Hibiscus sabdariffa]|uniref:Uncharacterized protein n=1 Tax=Hibiscus sabdariffa TaxID=183260 RepID=A0ABR2GBN9_9ROSI
MRAANSNVPQQVSTEVPHVSAAYVPPTQRIPKFSVQANTVNIPVTTQSPLLDGCVLKTLKAQFKLNYKKILLQRGLDGDEFQL